MCEKFSYYLWWQWLFRLTLSLENTLVRPLFDLLKTKLAEGRVRVWPTSFFTWAEFYFFSITPERPEFLCWHCGYWLECLPVPKLILLAFVRFNFHSSLFHARDIFTSMPRFKSLQLCLASSIMLVSHNWIKPSMATPRFPTQTFSWPHSRRPMPTTTVWAEK